MIAAKPLRDRWPQIERRVVAPQLHVGLFSGCAIDFIYPEQAVALQDLLEGYDVQVNLPLD